MRTEPPHSPREKMAAYRKRLRKQGLRPVQVWIPDTRLPQFRQEARRQSLRIAKDNRDGAVTQWLETIADIEDWRE